MVKERYETIKTYKVLCERLMKLVDAKDRDELKAKLIDGENRNFTLVNEINEEELELRYLRTWCSYVRARSARILLLTPMNLNRMMKHSRILALEYQRSNTNT